MCVCFAFCLFYDTNSYFLSAFSPVLFCNAKNVIKIKVGVILTVFPINQKYKAL